MTSFDDHPEALAGVAAPNARFGLLGRVIAITGIVAAVIPSLVMSYWLAEAYLHLREAPTTSWRPLLPAFGVGLYLLGGAVCVPLTLLGDRIGTKADGELALLSLYPLALPLFFGFFGPLAICWATGSSFGS